MKGPEKVTADAAAACCRRLAGDIVRSQRLMISTFPDTFLRRNQRECDTLKKTNSTVLLNRLRFEHKASLQASSCFDLQVNLPSTHTDNLTQY